MSAYTYIIQILVLKHKIVCIIDNILGCKRIHDLHFAYNILNAYNFITKLCRQQRKAIQNFEDPYTKI